MRRALDIAADICVYTNRNLTIEAAGWRSRTGHGAGLRLPPDDAGRPAADPALAGARRMCGNGGAIRTSSTSSSGGDLDEPAMDQFIVLGRTHPISAICSATT